MQEDTEIYIHVGPHKCATTYLQRLIFPNLDNINYILNHKKFDIKKIKFDYYEDKIVKGKINLISNENLSGRQQFGGDGGNFEKSIRIADKLKEKFPNAKIIIGKRKIQSWLPSLYSQYIKSGGILDYNEWYDTIFDKKYIKFDDYIEYLEKLFNEIYIYNFYLLKENPEKLIKEICEFIGVEEPEFENKIINPKLDKNQMKLIKFLNRLWVSRKKTVVNATDIRHKIGFLPRKEYFNPLFITRVLTEKKFIVELIRFLSKYIGCPDNKKEYWKDFKYC